MDARQLRLTLASLLTVIACLACATTASAAFPDSFDVDTYQATDGPFVNTTRGTQALQPGVGYVVQVQGTMSLWTAFEWSSPRWRTCNGQAEAAPVIPTPGRPNGPVGIDAETRYAPLFETVDACPSAPQGFGNVQLTSTGAFGHPAPLSTSNPATHTYRYPVRGAGQPVAARFVDPHPQDNYGVFRFTVDAPTAADCAAGAPALGYASEAACLAAGTSGSGTSGSGTSGPGAPGSGTSGSGTSGSGASQSGTSGSGTSGFVTSGSAASTSAASSSLPIPPALDSGAGAVAGATAQKICTSRRAFTIRIVEGKRRPIRSAKVTALGRTFKATRRTSDGRLVAKIDFRTRPANRFSVQISVVYADGTKAKGVRKYFTCAVKRASKPPKL